MSTEFLIALGLIVVGVIIWYFVTKEKPAIEVEILPACDHTQVHCPHPNPAYDPLSVGSKVATLADVEPIPPTPAKEPEAEGSRDRFMEQMLLQKQMQQNNPDAIPPRTGPSKATRMEIIPPQKTTRKPKAKTPEAWQWPKSPEAPVKPAAKPHKKKPAVIEPPKVEPVAPVKKRKAKPVATEVVPVTKPEPAKKRKPKPSK